MTPTVSDLLGYSPPMVCVCGQLIPDRAIVYGFEQSEDNDAPMAFINEWHEHCLGEWGWRRDDSEFGIAHVYCVEESDEQVIRRRLASLDGYV